MIIFNKIQSTTQKAFNELFIYECLAKGDDIFFPLTDI